ncbi:MAG: hypothetical protein IAE94_02700 [Chthoniobacterales bacterium]|nr:hypothetical protein [Chthoniobacterales bacterium]
MNKTIAKIPAPQPAARPRLHACPMDARALLASLRDAARFSSGIPVVSLRSTSGYMLPSLRDDSESHTNAPPPSLRDDSESHTNAPPPSLRNDSESHTNSQLPSLRDAEPPSASLPEAGGFPAGSRWLRSAATTPPDHVPQKPRIPAGMPAQNLRTPLASRRDAVFLTHESGGVAALNHRLHPAKPSASPPREAYAHA